MMIKESGVNMDNQLYNQIKAVHEQYIKEQNRLEDEIDRLRREIVCLDNEDEIEALNKLVKIDDINFLFVKTRHFYELWRSHTKVHNKHHSYNRQ